MRLRILHKGLAIVILPLIFQLAFASIYFWLLSGAMTCLDRERFWQQMCAGTQAAGMHAQYALQYAYLYKFDGDKETAEKEKAASREYVRSFRVLGDLLSKKDKEKLVDFDASVTMARGQMKFLSFVMSKPIDPEQKISEGIAVPPSFFYFFGGNLPQHRDHPRNDKQVADVILQSESLVQAKSAEFNAKSKDMELLINSMFAFSAALSLALAAYFYLQIGKRLSNVKTNTELLSQGKQPSAPVGGTDEFAQVDAAVHDCAGQIVQLEAFKGQMVGVVSHELKSPLSSVQIVLSLFSSGALGEISEAAARQAQKSEKNLDRLLKLVADLLTLEKLESTAMKLRVVPTGSQEIVNDALQSLEGMATGKGIRFNTRVPELELNADRDKLVQVMVNLLSNAIKFSEKDFVEISVSCSDSGAVEFRVTNFGRGIPESHKDQLFQRFAQVEVSDATKRGGSGLGLAIAKNIIDAHGGQIGFESEGEKTSFWFCIPKESAQKTEVPKISETAKPELTPAPLSRQRRFSLFQKGVLLVGAPLLINLFLLFSLKSMWTTVVTSLDNVRQASSVASKFVLVGDGAIRYFWDLLFLCRIDDDIVKKDLQRHIDDEKEAAKAVELILAKNGNPQITAIWKEAKISADRLMSGVKKAVSDDIKSGDLRASGLFAEGGKTMQLLSRAVDLENAAIKRERKIETNAVNIMRLILLLLPLASVSLSGLLALFFARNISGRLANIAVNASRLSNRQSLSPPIGGADEIGDLDLYFHQVASQIVELEEYKERMIGVASHELRSPLTALLVSIELLQAETFGPISTKAKDRLAVAREETGRLIRLINNLLDLEKMQSGKLELDRHSVEIKQLLLQAQDAVKILAERKQIDLVLSESEYWADWDKERIVQVLVNLLSNAIKYSPVGGTVKIDAEKKEDSILLSVSDQGRGIAKERKNTLFDRFQQINSEDYQMGGTGLGLAISKWLVELHGGSISVDSEEGQGTSFRCLIPVEKPSMPSQR